MMRVVLSVVIACGLTLQGASLGSDVLLEAEKAAAQYRASIRSAEVLVNSEVWMSRTGTLKVEANTSYRMTTDGVRLRTDIGNPRAGELEALVMKSFSDGVMGCCFDVVGGNSLVPIVWDATQADALRQYKRWLYDPRLVGLAPISFGGMSSTALNSFLGSNRQREDTVVAESFVGGERVLEATFLSEGKACRVRINMDRGPSLVFAEVRDGRKCDTVLCEIVRYQQEVWYPSAVTFTKTSGDAVEYKNVATVASATFNSEIDGSVFSLAGVGVLPGKSVIDTRNGRKASVWDGQRIVERGSRSAAVERPKGSGRKWRFGVFLGGIVTCLGLLCLGRSLQVRSSWSGIGSVKVGRQSSLVLGD